MGYQSEAELEKQLIKRLADLGYSPIQIKGEEGLIQNFKEQFSIHNKEALRGEPLTKKEFERVLRTIEGKSVFQSSKILRDKIVLERDSGEKIHLELFNSRHWCKNIFQVTSQITMMGKYENRYDVTILINGLPLIQIELKRRGLDMKEAFNQINRYRKHSFKGLFRFIQIFIISNGVDTKYFANGDKELLYSHTFFWTNAENERITQLSDFTFSFLETCQAAKLIARYMVLNESQKSLMVMRPYQIFAVEHFVERATETSSNGFVWHTTGSGKTLTSFKLSQILAKEKTIKKVFFLVDRRDLDGQTIREFNAFEKNSVDSTDKTEVLINQMLDQSKPLIVTTIQKMANAIRNPKYENIMKEYRNEKVIFIIDECHRSQFGKMHVMIQKHFNKAQYFGFTGTPRFEENKSQDGRTTADIFEKCLHTYLIKDAIRDQNVLGFSVEYIQTVKGDFDSDDDTRVSSIDTDEVFLAEERLEKITSHILKTHDLKTRGRTYTAMFAVQSVEMLVKYYEEFKKRNHDLKIAGIYTFKSNEESEGKTEHSRDYLEKIIADYNGMFGTTYSTDTFQQYFVDVSKRVKNAEIDILIVVNMFLTGFDAKTLNTLYVDKPLKYHDLIQAYSRTNRVEKSTKPYGNVVCYRNLKERTDEAIRLFSRTDSTDTVLMKSFEHYLKTFKDGLGKMLELAPTPKEVDLLESEEEMKAFVVAFRDLSRILVSLQTFVNFEFDKNSIGISEQEYQDFKSKYFLIYDQVKSGESSKASILSDVDFCIELMRTDRVNISYILELIKSLDLESEKRRQKGIESILTLLDRADNEELRLKVELIRNFLTQVVPNLSEDDDVEVAYNEFERKCAEEEIQQFAVEVDLPTTVLKDFISEYRFAGKINHSFISLHVKAKLKEKKMKIERIKKFIIEHVQKFN